MARPVLHLSTVVHSPLVDRAGERLGRVEDLIVRLDGDGLPPLTGLEVRIGGRDLFVPAAQIASLTDRRAELSGEQLNLQRFERRPAEVLLRHDILGRALVHVDAARLVTAHEIDLWLLDGRWRVAGIHSGARGLWRRLVPPRLARGGASFVDWGELEPFVGHVPTARLRRPHRKLVRLHPAQIADLVEAASHAQGEEIIEAVGEDSELEADVFEELDEEHQGEFIRERSDAQVAAVLARMASDEAADAIEELPEERRSAVLGLLPPSSRRQIGALLGYASSTAGGLMGIEFVALPGSTRAADAIRAVHDSKAPAEALTGVYVRAGDGRVTGWVSLVELMQAEPARPTGELPTGELVTVTAEAGLPEVARLMSDFNLTMLVVVDERCHPIGVITVDDVLELTLPSGWRRRYGVVGR